MKAVKSGAQLLMDKYKSLGAKVTHESNKQRSNPHPIARDAFKPKKK